MRAPTKRSAGFALPSAIFLLVILAGLAAFLVNISMTQSATSTQDVQGARAYHAAKAGIEWGLYQVLDPLNTTVVAPGLPTWPNMPACAAGVIQVAGFNVAVQCQFSDHSESGQNRQIRVYVLQATASVGVVGTATYVERQVSVTASVCRALDGVAPGFECP